MKVYIEEDELWPVYFITPETAAEEYHKKYNKITEMPDHLVEEYNKVFGEFQKIRQLVRDHQEEQE